MDHPGYCVEKRIGAKGGSKPSKDIYWLMEVEFVVFGLGCSVRGRQDWRLHKMDYTKSKDARPQQTVHG